MSLQQQTVDSFDGCDEVEQGYRAAAAQRGESIARLKVNAERARERLRMVA